MLVNWFFLCLHFFTLLSRWSVNLFAPNELKVKSIWSNWLSIRMLLKFRRLWISRRWRERFVHINSRIIIIIRSILIYVVELNVNLAYINISYDWRKFYFYLSDLSTFICLNNFIYTSANQANIVFSALPRGTLGNDLLIILLVY
jgi:hypothetical protein